MENTRSLIGSFNGANHTGFTVTGLCRYTLENTSIKSPKYPPNITPQNKVDSPQYMNSRMDFCIPLSILGNFRSTPRQTANTISP